MELVFIRMGYPCRIYGLDFPPLRGSTVVLEAKLFIHLSILEGKTDGFRSHGTVCLKILDHWVPAF